MKDIIIICLIIIIIVVTAIAVQSFLNRSADDLIAKTSDLKEKIQSKEQNVDINKETEKLYLEWKQTNQKWAIVIPHDELDLIETSFTRMKAAIECGETEDSLEEIDVSIFLLNHIKEKEKFCIKNII